MICFIIAKVSVGVWVSASSLGAGALLSGRDKGPVHFCLLPALFHGMLVP